MANTVTITGMFGNDKTYFIGSPVIIKINGLEWPPNSPFNIVRVEVSYQGSLVGDYRIESNRQSSVSLDISSALRAIWVGYKFDNAVIAANNKTSHSRGYRSYKIAVYTEYIDSSDGEFVQTYSGEFSGGRCCIGKLTEWERYSVENDEDADASYWEHSNTRNGDASTKPKTPPERVGLSSITSWVDISNIGTKSYFYSGNTRPAEDSTVAHAPIVLRDSINYQDFLFLNRRGAIETCSGMTLEDMIFKVEKKQYGYIETPKFKPSQTLVAKTERGRRSWQMSSGYVTREWAEWWAQEFLMSSQYWMLYNGSYVPIIVEPAKTDISIYDNAKREMAHVDFNVTLSLEG